MAFLKRRTDFINEKYKTADQLDKKLLGNGFIPESMQDEYRAMQAEWFENPGTVENDPEIEKISNANWFALNPEKIAGTMVAGTGFLNPVITKGSIDQVVETIDNTLKNKGPEEAADFHKTILKYNPKKFKDDSVAWSILDNSAAEGSDWMSGGCGILAEAFKIAFDYEIYAIYNLSKKLIDHFVVKTDKGTYLDADGEQKDIVRSFAKKEGITDKLELLKFTQGMDAGDIPFDNSASKKLAELLISEFSEVEKIINSEPPKTMKQTKEKQYDLLFTWAGGVTVVSNRLDNDKGTNDYRVVAHIYQDGKIKYFGKDIPAAVVSEIEAKRDADKPKSDIKDFFEQGKDAGRIIISGSSSPTSYPEKQAKPVVKSAPEEVVYIEFLDASIGHKQNKKYFNTYSEGVEWGRKNIDNFHPDMLKYEPVETAGYKEVKVEITPEVTLTRKDLAVIVKKNLVENPTGSKVQSVEETIEKYNTAITEDEIKAWVYYKRRFGNPMRGWEKYFLSGGSGFSTLLQTTTDTVIKDNKFQDLRTIPDKTVLGVKTKFKHEYQGINYVICKTQQGELVWIKTSDFKEVKNTTNEDQKSIDHLVRSRALIFDGTEYYPVPVFLFGDIYEKIKLLDTNEEAIVSSYGQEHYQMQMAKVREYLPKIKSFRDPVKTNRPHMLCLSEFAIDPVKFGILALNEESGVKLGYEKRGRFQAIEEKISLFSAFKDWMRETVKDIDLKNTTRADIHKYYFAKSISWPKDRKGNDELSNAKKEELIGNARLAAEDLFSDFLATALSYEDGVALDAIWNQKYNAFTNIIQFVDKIPVGFNGSTWFKDGAMDIKPAQRQGLAYLQLAGSGCLAYDVGFGKTLTGILNLAQEVSQGAVKRPLIVVPKPTYKNWLKELFGYWTDGERVEFSEFPGSAYYYGAFSGITGVKLNDWYNLGGKHFERVLAANGGNLNKLIPEGTITVVSYSGFAQMGFSREISADLFESIARVIMQKDAMEGQERTKKTEKKEAKDNVSFYQKIQGWLGLGNKNAIVNVDQCGFDHITVDEAHNFKNAFPSCGKDPATGRKLFNISAGQSSRAVKMFFITNYIQVKHGKKVVLLTATPFTNSPLEIYSMLSYVGLDTLNQYNLFNIKKFFEQFVLETIEYAIDAKGEIITKPVIKSFQNLKLLQTILFNHFHYKDDPKEAGVVRPCKIDLPNKDINTFLEMNEWQKKNQVDVKEMAKSVSRTDPGAALRAMGMSLDNAFSPYLMNSDVPESAEQFVNNSPKIKYAVECIRSVKQWHENRGESCSGIVIYSNRGKSYFDYIQDYLIQNVGFKTRVNYDDEVISEVEIITGGGGEADEDRKELLKDAFNAGILKVLIGTGTIREGINLQKRGTVILDLYPEWNPTDVTQLKGRIWRQGNMFGYIRFVMPLVINSMDNFINQKLDEKGKRIANIWAPIGDLNVIENTSDLDPAEIKYQLVDDATEKFKMKFDGLKMDLQRQLEILTDNKNTLYSVQSSIDELKAAEEEIFQDLYGEKQIWATVLKYLKSLPLAKFKKMPEMSKTLKDIERVIINVEDLSEAFSKYEANRYDIDLLLVPIRLLQQRDFEIFTDYSEVGRQIDNKLRDLIEYNTFKISDRQRLNLVEAWGEVRRAERSVLGAYGKTWLDEFNEIIIEVDKRLRAVARQQESIESPDYKEKMITAINAEMEAAKSVRGDLTEQVARFASLNHTLSYLSDNTDRENCPIPTEECCPTNGIQVVHQDKSMPEPVMFEEIVEGPVLDPAAEQTQEIKEAIEEITEMLPDLKGKLKKEAQEALEFLKEMLSDDVAA